ncbi:hypothetical protein ACG7TL_007300 [Trametes sanguinea]
MAGGENPWPTSRLHVHSVAAPHGAEGLQWRKPMICSMGDDNVVDQQIAVLQPGQPTASPLVPTTLLKCEFPHLRG